MAKVYAGRIRKAAVKSMGQKPLRDQAYKIMQEKLEEASKETITEFNQPPVKTEIEAGPRAENLSGTLGGYGNCTVILGLVRDQTQLKA